MPIDSKAPGRVTGVSDDDVLKEARDRYQKASDFASENRQRYREAMRFVAGNQWDDRLRTFRESSQRPCLVMDRLGTHINQVVNDQRQNKPAIKVHPVDDFADVETAKVLNGAIRNIEHRSNAPMVYETASFTQVSGGQGAWRILTEYSDEESFEQDICLKRILDPTCVTFDPDAKEQDASDGMYCFVEDAVTRDRFESEYPDVDAASWPSTNDPMGWWTNDSVRVAEYYRVVMRPTTIFLMEDGSVMEKEDYDEARRVPNGTIPPVAIDSRPAKVRQVQWFKLGGHSVIDSRVVVGRWIPVVRVIGNEMVVDGKIIYTGLTHRAMDPQRMYNYQTSVVVEMLSLAKTAPYIGAKGQFKGVEKKWLQANVTNPAYLEYEPVEINGALVGPPQRQSAPQVPTGNVQAMEIAAQDLQWVTGQHAANFGAQSNETSGRAIIARQKEGDSATYHYLDNLSRSILHTGRILVDIIPKVYDTKRVLRIIGEDEQAQIVTQDPQQQESMLKIQKQDGSVERIYNLDVGKYDVAVAVGPSFGTKRLESVEAMTQLLSANPELWQAVGDLFLRSQDWPGAAEMADRLKKMVPPNLLDQEKDGGVEVKVAGMQQALMEASQMMDQKDAQLQQADQILQQLQAQIEAMQRESLMKDADVEGKTESERIKADAEVRVATINAAAEALRVQQDAMKTDVAALQKLLIDLAAQGEKEPEEDGEEPEPNPQVEAAAMLLAGIAESQRMLMESSAALQAALVERGQMPALRVSRGEDGRMDALVPVQ